MSFHCGQSALCRFSRVGGGIDILLCVSVIYKCCWGRGRGCRFELGRGGPHIKSEDFVEIRDEIKLKKKVCQSCKKVLHI